MIGKYLGHKLAGGVAVFVVYVRAHRKSRVFEYSQTRNYDYERGGVRNFNNLYVLYHRVADILRVRNARKICYFRNHLSRVFQYVVKLCYFAVEITLNRFKLASRKLALRHQTYRRYASAVGILPADVCG